MQAELQTARRCLNGKVAIVTGASRGIGKEIALNLAGAGARVAITARSMQALEGTLEELRALGAEDPIPGAVDVRNAQDVGAFVDKILDNCGRVDILVNNAGITKDGLILRMSESDWDDVLNTNLKGAFLFTKACAKPMMKQRSGKIINIASVIGLMGNAGQANYAASKAGIIALTKSVAKELGSRNILVNAIAPGFIETDMTHTLSDETKSLVLKSIPLGVLGKAKDIAHAALFLASSDSDFITGQVITIDGGMVMA